MFMFGRFTERAQQVLVLSQEEAKRLSHNFIGTEHLLLGLVREGSGVAARALQNMGVDLNRVRQQVERITPKGEKVLAQSISYTPRAKRVVELAIEESQNLGHNYVGTEHIMLGLLREGEGIAAQVLSNLQIDLKRARKEVIQLLGGEEGAARSGSEEKRGPQTPTVDTFGRDLTRLAREGKLDPVIGRDKEIERLIQVLSRRTKNNPCLIGEPGVGKTAIAEGLAQRITEGNVPEILRDKRLVTIELAAVVAGTKYRGEFEERLRKLMQELREAGNVMVFIDELHTLIGAGAAEGAIDASNILKPALSRGELQCIGATTLDEYRKHIEKDPALERRFQPITVGEPTREESLAILKGLRDRYEAHHKVKITDEALETAVQLADRYITDRFLPDKAIDLIDEAASRVRIRNYTAPPDLKEMEEKLHSLRSEKEAAVRNQEFELAAKLRDQEHKFKEELDELKREWEQKIGTSDQAMVTDDDVAYIVSSWTGVPVKKLAEGESERLLKLEEIPSAGHRAGRGGPLGLAGDPARPGRFEGSEASGGLVHLLGPTGWGKRSSPGRWPKRFSRRARRNQAGYVRVYGEAYRGRLIEGRRLCRLRGGRPADRKIRRKPYSVILFDEMEKAHPDVFNVLLQILEDGRLTDGKGRTVDFRNAVVIMTSNVGATFLRKSTLGFGASGEEAGYEKMKERVLDELKRTFRPEFLNRVDDIIVFHALNEEHISQIVGIMLAELNRRIAEFDLKLEVSEPAKARLVKEGYDPSFGARPLRRVIQKRLEDGISEEMLQGKIKPGNTVFVDLEDGQFSFRTKSPQKTQAQKTK